MDINQILPALWYFLGAVVFIAVVLLIRRQVLRQQAKRASRHNPRSHNVNETIYNIDGKGMAAEARELTKEEARQLAKHFRESGQIPTRETFFQMRRVLKDNE